MDVAQVTDIFRDGVGVAIRLGAPILLMSMVVGVFTAILQAVTQIHEQTISFVFKLIVVVLFMMIGGSWMLTTLQDFFLELIELMRAL